jgi:hypothetical protein
MPGVCEYCNKEYEDAFQLHWNTCYEARKISGSFPPSPMPNSSIDWADPPKTPRGATIWDKKQVCEHCLCEYNYSWNDHAEVCSAVAANRAKRFKQTQEPTVEKRDKSDKELLSDLLQEVEALKKQLEKKK